MSKIVRLIATADAPRTAPSPESGDFTPEPIPSLSDWIDAGLAQAKEAQHDVFTVVDTLAQMVAHSARASSECQLRVMEMARANAAASYALAGELFAATSWTRMMEVSADAAPGRDRGRASARAFRSQPASVPIPKFAHPCGTLRCELRNQRDTSNSMILVPL